MTILVDTGPSSSTILHNIDAMKIDTRIIDAVFLSHGHYDHTGGLVSILGRIGKKVPVIAHPSVFEPKLKIKPHLKYIGPPFTRSEVEAAAGMMLCAKNPVKLAEGIMTSGEVERVTAFEKTQGFYTIKEGKFVDDNLPDDQALVAHIKGKGLAVISGCAHSGIINTIRHVQKVTGVNDIYAIVGGFHLEKAHDDLISATVEDLRRINPRVIAPCHCTGSKGIKTLTEAFGSRCTPLRTGDNLVLHGEQ